MAGENSLSDEATLAGKAKRRPASEVSLGDERTLGDNRSGQDTVIDDIEIVDLESRYNVEGTLGQGGMGAVLLATDTRLDRKVAIKRILGEAAGNRMAVQRFLTEAKAIAAINHPNIVQIHDYGRAKDGPFLIMEYVDGGSLLDRCRDSALPLDEAIDLACQLCDGLAKAHDLGIVHRDIKPANVLLTKDGIPKLTDFGLAKAQAGDHGQTMTGAVLGTPDFMPPEQRRDASLVDHRSDLWSLAATVYQMVTGRSPKVIRLHELAQTLQPVMARALEDAKDARYQSAREFRDALKTGLRSAAPATAVAEVGEGQCPACSVQNDASRKFCRGCGASLFAPCLECTQPMPIWEDICGSCGAKQTPLVETKQAEMAAAQAKAEGLLGDFEFDKAAAIVTALRDEPSPRLGHLKPWTEQFLKEIDKGRQEQLARAAAAATEALAHEKAYDYAAGIRALEPLPPAVRMLELPSLEGTAGEVLDRLDQKLRAAKSLETAIRDAIKSKAMSGLLEKVIALAKLRPDRADIAKLRTQLEARQGSLAKQRDDFLKQAQQAMEKQDYATALKILSQVDADVVNFDVGKLRTDAQQRGERINALRDQIKVAISENRYGDVLKLSDDYLRLKPMAPDLERIRSQAQTEVRRAATRRRWKRVAAITAAVLLVGSGIGMQAWRNAHEKHLAAIEEAIESKKWDEALALDPKNGRAYVGRARVKLKSSPPDVSGAFEDLKRAESLSADSPLIIPARADAYAVRAAELARADRLDDAAKDLSEAERADAAGDLITEAKNAITTAWAARAERAITTLDFKMLEGVCGRSKQLGFGRDQERAWWIRYGETAVMPPHENAAEVKRAADKAVTAWADAPAPSTDFWIPVLELWRKYANGRIDKLDAKGLELACAEAAKAGLAAADEAEWWIRFGNAAAAPPLENAAQVLNAAEKALAAGAPVAAVAPLRAKGMILESLTAQKKGDGKAAVSGLLEAALLDAALVKATLVHPANAVLRAAVIAECRSRIDTGLSDLDRGLSDGVWDSTLQMAAAAVALDESASGWAGEAISKYPGGLSSVPAEVLGRMPAAMIAALPPLRNSIGIELKLIPPGQFMMGESGGDADATPHQVTLTKRFYIGVYEVTNAQWNQVMGSIPSNWKDDDRPVEDVSWEGAIEFCRKLSALPIEQTAGRVYRLPTEAEWEYACRSGTSTKYSFGDDESKLGEYGWFRDNSDDETHPVGKKKPNAWGLFDMHGNVCELCSDWYGEYPNGAATDPQGPSKARRFMASDRVYRSGCWDDSAGYCRSAKRKWFVQSYRNKRVGFRLALSPPGVQPVPPEAGE